MGSFLSFGKSGLNANQGLAYHDEAMTLAIEGILYPVRVTCATTADHRLPQLSVVVGWSFHRRSDTIAGVRSNIQKPSGRPMRVAHSQNAASIHKALAHQPIRTK